MLTHSYMLCQNNHVPTCSELVTCTMPRKLSKILTLGLPYVSGGIGVLFNMDMNPLEASVLHRSQLRRYLLVDLVKHIFRP